MALKIFIKWSVPGAVVMVSLQPRIMNLSLAIDRFESKYRFIDVWEGWGFFYYSVWLYEGKRERTSNFFTLYLPKWKTCLVPDYQYPNDCLHCPAVIFILLGPAKKKWGFSCLRAYRRNSLIHVVSCKKNYVQVFKWFIVVTVFSLEFLCNYGKITIRFFFSSKFLLR